jgi:energy-converting hydrogenase B subunit Q
MNSISLTITTKEEKGVLDEITDILSSHGINISYVHLYVNDDVGTLNLELDNVEELDELIKDLESKDFIRNIEIHGSLNDIFGKRILIFGGGAQVSQVAVGAITEADRHNIRGERISVDTIPLVGEGNIAEAVDAVNRLPRVHALVLAGSLMGGKITDTVKALKEKHEDLIVITLNMPGSVTKEADLIVTDPVQAGVMAVMAVASTAVFDVKRLANNNKF